MQNDGSGTLDSVVSTTTNGLVVNNANLFQSNQDIDVWSALGGTFRGTATIQTLDIANNTIWLTTAYPAGTQAADLLLVNEVPPSIHVAVWGCYYQQNLSNDRELHGHSAVVLPWRLLDSQYHPAVPSPRLPFEHWKHRFAYSWRRTR